MWGLNITGSHSSTITETKKKWNKNKLKQNSNIKKITKTSPITKTKIKIWKYLNKCSFKTLINAIKVYK